MSRAQVIRTWMVARGGSCTAAEVTAADLPGVVRAAQTLFSMKQRGIVTLANGVYTVAREFVRRRLTDAERDAAKRAHWKRSNARRGGRTPEQKEARRKRERERDRQRTPRNRAPANRAPRAAPAPRLTRAKPEAAPAAERRDVAADVAAWMAQGNAPERLPPGASAEPLKFGGFRDFTNNFRGSAASEG